MAPYTPQHLGLSVFRILAIAIRVYWYFIVVLICNSLVIYHVVHLFFLIVLFLAALGFHHCMWAFSSCCDQAPHCSGFRFCRAWILGFTSSVAVAQGLIYLGACGVSLGRGQTSVPCSTRWICSQGDP